jgi:Immunity protein 50
MSEAAFIALPGGKALADWFGRVPRFHDAELQAITLASRGPSTLRIRTWNVSDKVDAGGYHVLDKHVIVTMTLEEITHVALSHFDLPGIILDLEVTSFDGGYQLVWSASYGVEGAIRAGQVRIDWVACGPEDHRFRSG